MVRELVPFNDMWYVPGLTDVFRLKGLSGANYILCNINNVNKIERVPYGKALKLNDAYLDGVRLSDALEKLYELEMEDEVPAPDELDQMDSLIERIGYEKVPSYRLSKPLVNEIYAVSMSKIVQIYYNIMELADDFDIPDPYDNSTNNEI